MRSTLIWTPEGALFVGPVAGAEAHACETLRVYVPLADRLLLDDGGRLAHVARGTPAVVEGLKAHRVEQSTGAVACLVLDRAACPSGSLRDRLADPACAPAIRRWVERLQEVDAGTERRPRLWPALLDPFGLRPLDDPPGLRLLNGLRVLRRAPGDEDALDRAAAAAQWSGSRLRHVARLRTGMSLKRYRLWAKLARAVACARAGANLTEAAYAAGFSSSSHLSAAHAAMFGCPPSRLLARLRRDGAGPARSVVAHLVPPPRPAANPERRADPLNRPSEPPRKAA